jgi:CubicO group peptidase (beta-lactamase class C family)
MKWTAQALITTTVMLLLLAAGCGKSEPAATAVPLAPPPLTLKATPMPMPTPIPTEVPSPTPTLIPTPIPTEAPSPTPTLIPTLSPPDIVGLWKADPLDGKDDGRRLIGISQKADDGLEMAVIALDITTRAWAGLEDIDFQEGILHCTIPGWGRSEDVFDGTMQADKAAIDLSEDGRQYRWERVQDAETIEFFQGLVSSIDEDRATSYVYQPPDEGIDGWESAHLAEVGIDEQLVNDLVDQILQGRYFDIHDILIVKDGKLVLEEYFRLDGRMHGPAVAQAYRDCVHILASSTKSITSLLIGLAIDEGFIESIEAPVYGFFPEYQALIDKQKERILLKHFLTMTAGLEWDGSLDVDRMWSGQDIVELVLGKLVVAEPGERFNYSNGISTVLGAIVERASQMEVAEFSDKYLFTPLGIENYHWQKYPDGTTDTDGNLALRPLDLAKIGQMVLDDGRYDGAQIVSEEWIRESTERRVQEQPGRQWYGYQWWQTDFNVAGETITAVHSSGWGGQFVFIFPELELVFVAHGANFDEYKEDGPFRMLERYILPAVLSSGSAAASPTSPPLPTVVPSPPPPGKAGVGESSDPRIAEIEALMAAYEQADTFSGAVLVAEGGQVVYERAVGYANREWLIPNALDTRFRIASLSKQFTKVLVLQLVEEGKLSLSGKIADYLPGYSGPGADRITVKLLMDHRSGIVGESAVQDLERIERDYYTQAEMLDLIAGYDLWFRPNARWGYSNFGYYLLGAIIESVSGRTYAELLQERICAPAGMQDTFPEVTGDIIARRASGHWLDAERGWAHDSPLDMSFVFGYGQLISTVRDLYLFDVALREGKLLNRAHTHSLVGAEAEYSPLGDGSCEAYVVEDGPASINGFRASSHSYTREDRFVVVLENVRGDGAVPVFDVGRNIAAILYGCSYNPPEMGE